MSVGFILKETFKDLKKYWKSICLLLILVTGASALLGVIDSSMILNTIFVVLSAPIVAVFMWRIVKGEKELTISNFIDEAKKSGGVILTYIITNIFVFLWSLLFVIPGIVKAFSYQRAIYLKANHKDMPIEDAITKSRQDMKGHKGSFFLSSLIISLPALIISVVVFAVFGPLLFFAMPWSETITTTTLHAELFVNEAPNSAKLFAIAPILIVIFVAFIAIALIVSVLAGTLSATFNRLLDEKLQDNDPSIESVLDSLEEDIEEVL